MSLEVEGGDRVTVILLLVLSRLIEITPPDSSNVNTPAAASTSTTALRLLPSCSAGLKPCREEPEDRHSSQPSRGGAVDELDNEFTRIDNRSEVVHAASVFL